MSKLMQPIGARILVEDIVSSLSDVEKFKRAGLVLVTATSNNPKNTLGRVLRVGTDPFILGLIKEGDIVFFHWHAGTGVIIEDKQYRTLEWQEVIGIEEKELTDSRQPLQSQDDLFDLLPGQIATSNNPQ